MVLLLLLLATYASADTIADRELLEAPQKVPGKLHRKLDMWYHPGQRMSIQFAFMNVILELNLTEAKTDGYELYQSANRSRVLEEHEADNKFFGLFKRVIHWKSKQIAPFERVYVGVDTKEPYMIFVKLIRIDYIRLFLFVGAIVLFLYAGKLARNVVFYYSSGCAFGLVASLLLIVFVIYRVTPTRTLGIPILLGGWSFSFYLIYALWQNLYTVLLQYQKWVAAYLVSVLLLSFGVCYRLGPPTNKRSYDLVQWALQLVALGVIYGSCQIPQLSLSLIGALVFVALFSRPLVAVWTWLRKLIRRFWPQSRRMLTEEEYEEEGRVETKRALNELRKFCRSPDANAWRITSRLRSPQRFAEFIEGAEHVDDEETEEYERYGDDFEMDDGRDGNDYDPEFDLPRNAFVRRRLLANSGGPRSADRMVSRRLMKEQDVMSKSFSARPTVYASPHDKRSGRRSFHTQPAPVWHDEDVSSDEDDE
uniref:Nuclear envelope integral membrane protein 1 n=1 Tax=Plectus sambesii TaxID=2011161 RepID=A0A914V1A3_9BILA